MKILHYLKVVLEMVNGIYSDTQTGKREKAYRYFVERFQNHENENGMLHRSSKKKRSSEQAIKV